MRKAKKVAAALAIAAAMGTGGMALATPASAGAATSVTAQKGIWWIFNFYPDEGTCEAQRRWGASQGWWTWDGSACATNGHDWALFLWDPTGAGKSLR